MNLPKEISAFMEKYSIDADEIWAVRQGAYAIKHKALERVAAEQHIEQSGSPVLEQCDQMAKTATVLATMRKNGRIVSSFGEAAPYNNKNSYPIAMAEKRAIDRCILKLLQIHGAVYSESEADEFQDPGDGQKGRLMRSTQMARDVMKQLQDGLRNAADQEHLDEWRRAHKEQIRALPQDYAQQLSEEYDERVDELRAESRAHG